MRRGEKRWQRAMDVILIATLVAILALFAYSMIDAYVLSIGERPAASPRAL